MKLDSLLVSILAAQPRFRSPHHHGRRRIPMLLCHAGCVTVRGLHLRLQLGGTPNALGTSRA